MSDPKVDMQLREGNKNQQRAPWAEWAFRELATDQYKGYNEVYTDWSETAEGVGAAAVCEGEKQNVPLPGVASIYSAKLHAIRLALEIIQTKQHTTLSEKKVLSRTKKGSSANALREPLKNL